MPQPHRFKLPVFLSYHICFEQPVWLRTACNMGAIVQTMATEMSEGNLSISLHVNTNVAHGLQIHAGSGCNANACITVQLAACVFCVQVLFVCGMSTRSTKAILKLHFIGFRESLHVGRSCYSCWHVFSRLKRAS